MICCVSEHGTKAKCRTLRVSRTASEAKPKLFFYYAGEIKEATLKRKMDVFFSATSVCWLSGLHAENSWEHNGFFLYLQRAATLIMQLSLSLLTVNNGSERWPWQERIVIGLECERAKKKKKVQKHFSSSELQIVWDVYKNPPAATRRWNLCSMKQRHTRWF